MRRKRCVIKRDLNPMIKVSFRFQQKLIDDIKRIADARNVTYNSLVRKWLLEAVEKEDDY